MPVTPKSKFNDNEKLLCYHGPLLYEAKCVKVKKESGNTFSYYVHYQGWNKNWDEWVNENRMLKINSESREKQKELLAAHLQSTKDSKSKAKGILKTPLGSLGGKRVSGPSSRASTPSKSEGGSETFKKRRIDEYVKFKICIPEELRYVLANDWDLIVRKKNLFILPAKISISSIVSDYLSSSSLEPSKLSIISQVLSGLSDFFNKFIGLHFLYEAEYKQFETLLNEKSKFGESYVDIYGSAHLLRLLSKIDSLLNMSSIDADSDIHCIEGVLEDFLKYLEDNMGKFFTSKNYKEISEES